MIKKVIGKLFGGSDESSNKSKKDSNKKPGKNRKPHGKTGKGHKHAKKPGSKKPQGEQRSSQDRNKKANQKAWSLDEFVVPEEEGKMRFHELDLPIGLMQGIFDLGFQYASPIQQQSLPIALTGKDVIGKAQTGTGKTAAFLISIINRLINNPLEERFASEPRALIIAPTRELVMQIGKDAQALCKHTDLNIVTIVGGMDFVEQQDKLRNDVVDILVATPGRLIDFMGRRDVFLDLVEVLVIDEADRMLDMGFIPDVRRIERATPNKSLRQTLLYSATFNDEIKYLTQKWTEENAEWIEIEPEVVATEAVKQHFYMVSEEQKLVFLKNWLANNDYERVMIFVNRRDQTRKLTDRLVSSGIKALLLSGEVAQHRRLKTLERFRSGEVKIVVATDVAGRGIHIDGVSHVFNFKLPEDPEDYVHRIGRTGRAGASGEAISLIDEEDAFEFPMLEKFLNKKLTLEQIPEQYL